MVLHQTIEMDLVTEPDMEVHKVLNILGDLYLASPTRELLGRLHCGLEGERHAALEPLRLHLGKALQLDDPGLDDLQTEFARLFVGPASLPCPPWESVYTSPNRQMMQEAFDDLHELHGKAGIILKETGVLPDHMGAELKFLALLLDRIAGSSGGERELAAELADKLLDDHLNKWIESFTQDVERAACLPLYRTVAMTTKAVVSLVQE